MYIDKQPYTLHCLTYEERKSRQLWPNGARMAMLFYTCPEQWEWDKAETLTPPGTINLPGQSKPSPSTRTAVDYGFHVGLPRIYDIAMEHDVKLTLGTTGNAAARHGPLLKRFTDAGHEIAAHGFSEGEPPAIMTLEEQARDIDTTIEAITTATGIRPQGWWSPGGLCTDDTVGLLADRKMLFHGDLQDDEIPYLVKCKDHTMVEIPYNMVDNKNDYSLFVQGYKRTVREHLGYLTSAFDTHYEQAASTPLLMIYGTHPFVSGHPEGAAVLAGLMKYVKAKPDVWIATYSDVAKWWISRTDHS